MKARKLLLVGVATLLSPKSRWPHPPAWAFGPLRTAPLTVHPESRGTGPSWALSVGLVATVIATSVGNYFVFLPLWGVPGPALWPMIYGTLIPFNAVKVLLTSAITLLLSKRVRDWLH